MSVAPCPGGTIVSQIRRARGLLCDGPYRDSAAHEKSITGFLVRKLLSHFLPASDFSSASSRIRNQALYLLQEHDSTQADKSLISPMYGCAHFLPTQRSFFSVLSLLSLPFPVDENTLFYAFQHCADHETLAIWYSNFNISSTEDLLVRAHVF